MQARPKRHGYTLSELLVVVTLLAIVAGGVVQLTTSSAIQRQGTTAVLKNILIELREIAITNHCLLELKLNNQNFEVATETDGGTAVATTDLAVALGWAPTVLSTFKGKLEDLGPFMADLKTHCELEDGSKAETMVFDPLGGLTDGQDRWIRITSKTDPSETVIHINGVTGLLEIQ